MVNQSKPYAKNAPQSIYGNKKPYNNIAVAPDEELAPVLVTKELSKDKSILKENMETWHIGGHRIPVAFAPIKAGNLDRWMKFFNTQVRTYIATGGTEDFLKEHGHEDDLSLTKFVDDAESDEDSNGFEPAATECLEDEALMRITVNNLLDEIKERNPKYGRILELLCIDPNKGHVLKEMGLGKSQGYADIKAAQKLARELYGKF